MKHSIKFILFSLFMTFCFSVSQARVVGTKVSGVPAVTITNADMQSQINGLSSYGFTSITLVSMQISSLPSGDEMLFVTFTFTPPSSTSVYTVKSAIAVSYSAGANQYSIPNSPRSPMGICVGLNCLGCHPSNNCSVCVPDGGGGEPECWNNLIPLSAYAWGPYVETVRYNIETWFNA